MFWNVLFRRRRQINYKGTERTRVICYEACNQKVNKDTTSLQGEEVNCSFSEGCGTCREWLAEPELTVKLAKANSPMVLTGTNKTLKREILNQLIRNYVTGMQKSTRTI